MLRPKCWSLNFQYPNPYRHSLCTWSIIALVFIETMNKSTQTLSHTQVVLAVYMVCPSQLLETFPQLQLIGCGCMSRILLVGILFLLILLGIRMSRRSFFWTA